MPAGALSSSGEVSTKSVPLTRKTRSPPGRRSRAASGIHRYGSHQIEAPYSDTIKVEARIRQRHFLGVSLDERKRDPMLGLHPPRRLELSRGYIDTGWPRTHAR